MSRVELESTLLKSYFSYSRVAPPSPQEQRTDKGLWPMKQHSTVRLSCVCTHTINGRVVAAGLPPPLSRTNQRRIVPLIVCQGLSSLPPLGPSSAPFPFPFVRSPLSSSAEEGGRRAFCWVHLSKCMEEEYLLYLLHLDISLRFECPLAGSDDFLYIKPHSKSQETYPLFLSRFRKHSR